MKITTIQIPIRPGSRPFQADVPRDSAVLAISAQNSGLSGRVLLVDVMGDEQTSTRTFITLKTGADVPDNARYIGFATETDARGQSRVFLFEVPGDE